jgi:hypothetical protein
VGLMTTTVLAGICAILLGLLAIASCLYVQRGGHLRHRQGAKVLAGLGVGAGMAIVVAGAVLIFVA